MRQTWSFASAGQIVFGRNAIARLGSSVARMSGKRAFVVTDPTLIRAGLLEPVRASLSAAGVVVEVFDGGEPEPSLRAARACASAAKAFRPDVIVGVGGGSNLDLSKLAAILHAHGGDPLDYTGEERVPGPITPLVCVPTTAGTGSEVSPAAVFTDTDQQVKVSTLSGYLRPRIALVDPLLTVSCPPKVTADSGIDALTHAIEAFTAVDNADFPVPDDGVTVYQGRNPMSDSVAERAVVLCGRFLRRAVKDGSDLEARDGMALAATLGGLAFSNAGVALVHALEYPVGGVTHCSHGAGNGLLLPFVMRFNLPKRVPEFARLAALLGEDVAGLPEAEAAERAIASVERMRADIGIPARLRDLGLGADHLPAIADKAFAIRRLQRVNPRQYTRDDLEAVLRAAW